MRSLTRLATALIGAALLASLAVTPAAAGTGPHIWYADDDGMGSLGSCDGSAFPVATSIQDVVDAANPGDTIMVCPGTYLGTVTVNKTLNIRSVKPKMAVIMPAADHFATADMITLTGASDIQLRGFSILVPTGGTCETVGSLIRVNHAPHTVVRGNTLGITGTEGMSACGYDTGISVQGNSDGTRINWNKITDFQHNGMYVISEGDLRIKHNKINFFHGAYGSITDGYGIFFNPLSGNSVIRYNTVRSLSTGGVSTPRLLIAIYVSGGGTASVRRNTGENVHTFIYELGATAGVIANNNGWENVQNGLLLSQSSGVEVKGNQVNAAEKGINVDSSSSGNNIHDNDWGSSAGANDCNDASSGGGTANTANTWTNNVGSTSSPPGICSPAP